MKKIVLVLAAVAALGVSSAFADSGGVTILPPRPHQHPGCLQTICP